MTISTPSKRFQKLEPIRVFELAVDQIRTMILNGVYAVGEKLPSEQELSSQLSVGRSSVREALRVIEAEGFIEIKRGLGAFVVQNSKETTNKEKELINWLEQREETIEQVLQVRESIEGLAASLAAEHASEEFVDVIKNLEERFSLKVDEIASGKNECLEDCINDIAQLDEKFHLAIGEASGNDIVFEILSHILPAYYVSNKSLLYLSKNLEKNKREHNAIVKALINRDPIKAERAIREHIKRVKSEVIAIG
jgi:GntR family transcriptional regulator, transcriptional repressor for pyruvate dehydrogenase complex